MALTKVTGQVIKNTTDVTVGVLTVTNTLAVGGTVSIGGTLTYEDVTNVDAVGLITARNGIVVGSGITLSKDGDVFFTGIATGNGSGLTALNASNLGSGTVPTARLGSGTASSSTFLRGDSTFAAVTSTTINSNADNRVITGSGTANTLNGESNLTFNGNSLSVTNSSSNTAATFQGAGGAGFIAIKDGDDSTVAYIGVDGGKLKFQTSGSSYSDKLVITTDGDVGINRGSPAANLDIASTSEIAVAVDGWSAIGGGGSANLKIGGLTGSQYTRLDFYTGGSERLRIDSGGRLLIGSTDGASYADSSIDDLIVGSTASGKNDGITILSNTAQNGSLAFADSGGTSRGLVGYVHNGDYLRLHAGGDLKLRIDTDGLKFNSDTAAANALDDYEEGTFTPRLGGTTNSSTYYVTGTGWYRKIGNMVYTCVRFNGVDLDNNAAGEVKIHNLPYTVNSAASNCDSITTDAAYFNVVFSTAHQYAWYASNGGTSWVGLVSRNNTSWDSWPVSDFHASGLYINFSGWYQTDS